VNKSRIDLAKVVSKYIGETEKNLDAVVADAVVLQDVVLWVGGGARYVVSD
jgi:SpoVK/Ycf46/Vps4 family AAA+-type ATPase